MLSCVLHADVVPGPLIRLAFEVTNDGPEPVVFTRYEPFAGFGVRARVDGRDVPLSQPPASVQVLPVETRIEPGDRLRLETPVQLAFDPDGLFEAGDEWATWTIVHEPAPVELEVSMHLGDEVVGPCTARVEP